MCGIVGYVGRSRSVHEVLIDGLRRLEYRGYDSPGVAVWDGDELAIRRAVGQALEPRRRSSAARTSPASSGSATRAGPRTASRAVPNAHPHRRGRASRSSTTASSRTTARSARSSRPRLHHSLRHRHRARRAPDRPRGEAGSDLLDRPRARVAKRLRRLVRAGGRLDAHARPHRGREERRQPAHLRPRRRRVVPRQRHPGASCRTRARCCSSRTASSRCSRATACSSSTRTAT